METMENRKILVSLVAALALIAVMAYSASALNDFGTITSVEVNGVEGLNSANIAAFAGETLPVRVTFTSNDFNDSVEDVRVKIWISGAREYSVTSDRFDVLPSRTYSKLFSVKVPSDIDPNEDLSLEVSVESRNNGRIDISLPVQISAQRESYVVEVLDVAMESQISSGSKLALDIVLKNRGRQFAEDTFVVARIPALGVESKAYFGDLAPVDQNDPAEKEDAVERRMFLNTPSNAPAGVYLVEIQAYNSDSVTTVTKKVAIVGAGDSSRVITASNSKTFAAGEQETYTVTLVNAGNNVMVYDLVIDAPAGLSVNADEPVVAVPAGTSRTVRLTAEAEKAGKYNFAVNVNSDGNLVKTENFVANVEGNRAIGANATVLLTVVLAIIFVVLLVVLIVLLTRKPQKNEEFGESYY